jgi:hypothetical protein
MSCESLSYSARLASASRQRSHPLRSSFQFRSCGPIGKSEKSFRLPAIATLPDPLIQPFLTGAELVASLTLLSSMSLQPAGVGHHGNRTAKASRLLTLLGYFFRYRRRLAAVPAKQGEIKF